MSKYEIKQGFSLIELMIVIAIIGILAAIAIPNYQNYVKKGQVTEVLNIITSTKAQLTEYYNANGVCPPSINRPLSKPNYQFQNYKFLQLN